ncbi:hypothetical protein GCM10020367_52220 [Streptomyces sannanensis]|uniref:Uncharacterized protein n=1 Tax=Streptomyces sannanensis TaxID=285536 RepID=A0ABP6SJ68_9ACTN
MGDHMGDLQVPGIGQSTAECPSDTRIPRGSPSVMARQWHGPAELVERLGDEAGDPNRTPGHALYRADDLIVNSVPVRSAES